MTPKLATDVLDFFSLRYRHLIRLSVGGCIGALTACATYTDELIDTTHDGAGGRGGGTTIDARPAGSGGGAVDVFIPPVVDTGRGDEAARPPDGSPPIVDASRDSDAQPPVIDAGGTRDADATVPPPDTSIVDAGADADASAPPRDADATAPPPDSSDAAREADATTGIPDADASPPVPDVRDSGPTCWGTPSTHDEDGDGVVDECDNCPSVANANQADQGEVNAGQTADGVGDACDPRPAASGESIFLFDALTSGITADWNRLSGTWTSAADTFSETALGTGQELARNLPSSIGDYMVETRVTFNSLGLSASASLPFRMDGSRNGWACGISVAGGGQLFLPQVTGGTGEQNTTFNVAAPPPQAGRAYTLRMAGFGGSLSCMLSSGERVNRTGTTPPAGITGLRTNEAAATFNYLLIYRLGGTIP